MLSLCAFLGEIVGKNLGIDTIHFSHFSTLLVVAGNFLKNRETVFVREITEQQTVGRAGKDYEKWDMDTRLKILVP